MRRKSLRCSSGWRVRLGRVCRAAGVLLVLLEGRAKTAGAVPPAGPLMRRRSACMVDELMHLVCVGSGSMGGYVKVVLKL